MKRVKLFVACILVISMSATAQEARTKIQQKRIEQGVRSGELTHHETRQLERQQEKIRREKIRAHADGRVTGHERRKIRRDTRRANRNIARKKHNLRERS